LTSIVREASKLIALLAVSVVLGCNTTPSKPSLMANMAKSELTVYQLRAMDYEYAARFAQLVSAAVSDIVAASDEQRIRDNALQWRMWAMPQARSAAFDQDPFAGLIELWILARQQHQFFNSGGGKDWFDGQQPRALETTLHLQNESERMLAAVISQDLADGMRATGEAWVEAHPIEGQLYVRPTARADLASLVSQEQHGGLKAMGSMEETLRDLSDRVTILSAQTPLEVRFHAEYLVSSLFEDRVETRVDSVVRSIDEMAEFLDSFEGTLSAQTEALLAGIERERITVFDAIEAERIDIVAALGDERTAILNELDSQLAQASVELDLVGKGLIDYFFLRLVQVLVVMGVVLFLIVLLVLSVFRRRSAGMIDRDASTE
jgi:hypothetical protein